MRPTSFVRLLLLVALAAGVAPPAAAGGADGWTTLADGVELGHFDTGRPGVGGDSTVVVLRVDPDEWSLELLCTSAFESQRRLTALGWCKQFGLAAAVNAGMFATDYETHVGYCAVGGHMNSAGVNEYRSAAAFCPVSEEVAPFRLFDLDAPGVTIGGLRDLYDCVVQNLRLIKRSRENRWSPQEKRWSEVALGEDARGRALLVFCRTGYSMYDLNEILLSLPLDLVCAQHLEGGPEAQMYVGVGDYEAEFVGSYETAFNEKDARRAATRIPLVIGIRARGDTH